MTKEKAYKTINNLIEINTKQIEDITKAISSFVDSPYIISKLSFILENITNIEIILAEIKDAINKHDEKLKNVASMYCIPDMYMCDDGINLEQDKGE